MDFTIPLVLIVWQGSAIILALASLWFIISLILKRNDVADINWGLGFIVLGIFLWQTGADSQRFLLILTLISLWGLRLALHIGLRHRGKPEDERYKKWREEWGSTFYIRSFLQVYLLQGFFQLIIALPLFVSATYPTDAISIIGFFGIALWAVGFFFEVVGDYQLSRFKSDSSNKGKIMTTGLWRYTRHPNYFGEVAMWWGIFLIVYSSPFGFVAILSPLTITYLLFYVSGIPMLEKKYEGREDFESYKERTNAFFPWWPKN